MRSRRLALVSFLALGLAGCSRLPGCAGQTQQTDALTAPAPTTASDVADENVLTIAFLGDSLTAGLGLPSEQAYPRVIQDMFVAEGYGEIEVVNAGSSGDTTAGGLRRVEQLLTPGTRILVVALGGNDALRGLSAAQTHDNLATIIDAALAKNVSVLLAGMLAPTNLGEDYQTSFRNGFIRLSREYQRAISYVPFLLEGVAGEAALNQPDGIHPNEQGARVIAEHLYPPLRDIVDRLSNAAR